MTSTCLPLSEDGLLLVLPVPFKKARDGKLLCEEQATNGIDQWANHFSHVTIIAPLLEEELPRSSSTIQWRDPASLRNRDRVTFVPLPMVYTTLAFAASFARGRRLLREHIVSNRYLSFAIGGLIGDWGALGARWHNRSGCPTRSTPTEWSTKFSSISPAKSLS